MKRAIETQLLEWKKSSPRKPLIVRGARQVGKTYTIRQFGREHFARLAHLDLERDLSLRSLFDGSLAADGLIRQIEAFAGVPLSDGETLLFIDEIQAAPRAITALRYLYEERPDIPVIAAGSALEFALGDISFPVGRVSFARMFPMTFYEFLVAAGLELLARALPRLDEPYEGNAALHEKIVEELKKYLLVGGMPEAVKRFLESNSFEAATEVHDELAVSLSQSLVKYHVRADPGSLEQVFHQLPRSVGGQVRFTHLDRDRHIEKTKSSVQALSRALLFHPIRAADAHALPLGGAVSGKRFKPLFLDVGLMQYLRGATAKEMLAARDIGALHQGAIAEQFVGQELLAAGGTENGSLYYWSRAEKRGNAEVDYLIVRKGVIYPVEVKSGAAGRLKSLHQFLAEHPNSPLGIAFSPAAIGKRRDGNILFMPLYTRFDGEVVPAA